MVLQMRCQAGETVNTPRHASFLAPGEVLHDAGQNPIIASSIGKTQHTQVSKAPKRGHFNTRFGSCIGPCSCTGGFCGGFPTYDAAAVPSLVRKVSGLYRYRAGQVPSCSDIFCPTRPLCPQVGTSQDAFFVSARTRTL